MRVTTKIVTGVVAGLVIAAATALPAHAGSDSITDKKNDTVQSSVTVTDSDVSSKVKVKKDAKVDITKVNAKYTSKKLVVTIKVAKVKKGYADSIAVVVRTKKGTTAASSIIIDLNDPTLSSVISADGTMSNPAGLTAKTKAGKNGSFVITIPADAIGSPKKLSVAASVIHYKSALDSTKKIVTISDSTGSAKATAKEIKWTAFIKP